MSAYERGWADAERGKAASACPYAKGTGAAIAWRNGYREMLASVGLA